MAKLLAKNGKLVVKNGKLATDGCKDDCCGCVCDNSPTSLTLTLTPALISCIEAACGCTLDQPIVLDRTANPCEDGNVLYDENGDDHGCDLEASITYHADGQGEDCCYELTITVCATLGTWCLSTLTGTYVASNTFAIGACNAPLDDVLVA